MSEIALFLSLNTYIKVVQESLYNVLQKIQKFGNTLNNNSAELLIVCDKFSKSSGSQGAAILYFNLQS